MGDIVVFNKTCMIKCFMVEQLFWKFFVTFKGSIEDSNV